MQVSFDPNGPVNQKLPEDTDARTLYSNMIAMFNNHYGISREKLGKKLMINTATLADRCNGKLVVRNEHIFALMYIRNELGHGIAWEDIE